MLQLESLASIEGRELIRRIYYELRFKKNLSSFSVLKITRQICAYETELFRYLEEDVTLKRPLGFWSGLNLWLEEIVNRYYFTTINSFVYFGAAILLAIIGLRRFGDNFIGDGLVVFGVAFESLMLLFIFFIMLFSPNEEAMDDIEKNKEESESALLVREIGEIASDFSSAAMKLDKIADSISALARVQAELLQETRDIARANMDAVRPNPALLESMDKTRETLDKFESAVAELAENSKMLKRDEIENAVRKELEKLLIDKALGNYGNQK